jgi:hypothetical protein
MKKPDIKRRKFMLAVGAGSAGAVAVALSGSQAPQKHETASADDKAAGYKLTAHIRNYYRTTRV